MATLHQKLKLLEGLISGCTAKVGPFYATADLTRRCNLKCLGCYVHSPYVDNPAPHDPSVFDLDYDLFRELCGDLRAMGTQTLVLCGDGEPFLHPRLFEMLAVAQGVGCEVKLYTNGTMLTESAVDALIGSGLHVLRVSLWASSRAEFERNYPGTNPDLFDRVVEGLKRLSSRKAARNGKLPHLVLHEPIDVHNFAGIDSFVELAIETGCDGVSFSPLHSASGQLNCFALKPEDERAALRALRQCKQRLRALPLEDNIEETIARYKIGEAVCAVVPCYIAWLHARVKVDGTVQACNPCRFPLGNLRGQRFREIWNGAGFQEFRRKALTRQGLVELTQRCDCSYCCHISDSVRVHRLYKWLSPVFRPAEGRSPAAG